MRVRVNAPAKQAATSDVGRWSPTTTLGRRPSLESALRPSIGAGGGSAWTYPQSASHDASAAPSTLPNASRSSVDTVEEKRAHAAVSSAGRSSGIASMIDDELASRPRGRAVVSARVRSALEPHTGSLPNELVLRTGPAVDVELEARRARALAYRNEVWIGSYERNSRVLAPLLVHEAAHVASRASYGSSTPLWPMTDPISEISWDEARRRREVTESAETGANRADLIERLRAARGAEAKALAPGVAYRAQTRGDDELALIAARCLLAAWTAEPKDHVQLEGTFTIREDNVDALLAHAELAFDEGRTELGGTFLAVAMVMLARAYRDLPRAERVGEGVVDALLEMESFMMRPLVTRIVRARALLSRQGVPEDAAGTAQASSRFAAIAQLIEGSLAAAHVSIPEDVDADAMRDATPAQSGRRRLRRSPRSEQGSNATGEASTVIPLRYAAEEVVQGPPPFEGSTAVVTQDPTRYVFVRSPRHAVAGTFEGATRLARELFGQRASIVARDLEALEDGTMRYVVAALDERIDIAAPEGAVHGDVFQVRNVWRVQLQARQPGWAFLSVIVGNVNAYSPERASEIARLPGLERGVDAERLSDDERERAIFRPIDAMIARHQFEEAADALAPIGAPAFALASISARARYVSTLLRVTTYERHERAILEIFRTIRDDAELAYLLDHLKSVGQVHALYSDMQSTFAELLFVLGQQFQPRHGASSRILGQLRMWSFGPLEIRGDFSIHTTPGGDAQFINALNALTDFVVGSVTGVVDLIERPDAALASMAEISAQVLHFSLMGWLASLGVPSAILYVQHVAQAFYQQLGIALGGADALQRNMPPGVDFLRNVQDAIEWRVIVEVLGMFVGVGEAFAVASALRSGRMLDGLQRLLRGASRLVRALPDVDLVRYARLARGGAPGLATDAHVARAIAGMSIQEQAELAREAGDAIEDVQRLTPRAREILRDVRQRGEDLARAEQRLVGLIEERAAGRVANARTPDVIVVPDAVFERRFGSRRAGSAFVVENGRAVVYARPTATPEDLLDEVAHFEQLMDPSLAPELRLLGEAMLEAERWRRLSAFERVELFLRKVDLELDAKRRTLAMLDADDPTRVSVQAQLANLERLRGEAEALTTEQLADMSSRVLPMADFLEDPSWLFSKTRDVERIPRPDLPERPPRALSRGDSPEDRSAAWGRPGVRSVHQVGDEWTEGFVVRSDHEGRIVSIVRDEDRTTIVVEHAGRRRTYDADPGSEVLLDEGRIIQPGDVLAREPRRRYREVLITFEDNRTELRQEIRGRGRNEHLGWVQRGSESNRRGRVAEEAAGVDTAARLAERVRSGELTGWHRIQHQTASGAGFDGVYAEFSRAPDGRLEARVRIQEVKDYPDRYVPLADFTAIDDNLESNLNSLSLAVRRASDNAAIGVPSSGFEGLDLEHLSALEDALAGVRPAAAIRIEVVVTSRTRVGAERSFAGATTSREGSVLSSLRARIARILHYDALDAGGVRRLAAPSDMETLERP